MLTLVGSSLLGTTSARPFAWLPNERILMPPPQFCSSRTRIFATAARTKRFATHGEVAN